MKITVLSHDLYGFNKHIAVALEKQAHEVTYISTTHFSYTYKSIFHRLQNTVQKVLLKKNIKNIQKTLYVNNILKQAGKQDIILIIDPAHFNEQILIFARQNAKKMVAYNYDSTAILKLPLSYIGYFDRFFSFEKKDCEIYGFNFITNFNYFDKQQAEQHYFLKAFTIQSLSKGRLYTLNNIAEIFNSYGINNYSFIIYGKYISGLNKQIEFRSSRTDFTCLKEKFETSEIIIDLVREQQNGLSFRFFEAMAYEKKVITTNKDVATYDFYNPKNILIIDKENPVIPQEFLQGSYEPLPDAIYHRYTLKTWIQTVLNI